MGEQFQDGSVCVANVRLFNCGEINVVDGGQYLFFQCILQCKKLANFFFPASYRRFAAVICGPVNPARAGGSGLTGATYGVLETVA